MPVARTLWNRRIPARDGVELAADVLLPPGDGPFPTVMVRTPYSRGRWLGNPKGWARLVDFGYAFVTVDMRGRGDSDGEWRPRVKDPEDAYDAIEWAAAQPWSTGRIGMVGSSYEGLTQWWSVLERPPHLACIAPFAVGHSRQERVSYGTGVASQYRMWWTSLMIGRTMQYAGAPSWEASAMHTPLATLDDAYGLSRSAWRRYVTGEIDFPGWDAVLDADDYAAIDIPVLVGVGWWDDQDTLLAWRALQRARSAADCRLLIGPWDHPGNVAPRPVLGGVDVSAGAIDTIAHIERFLARHLRDEEAPLASEPRCRVFLTGANRWDPVDDWPDPRAVEAPWYLSSAGDARGLRGDGVLLDRPGAAGRDRYVFDPARPTRDLSDMGAFIGADPPLDRRYLQRRDDTLVYTSASLADPLRVSGRFRVRLFVSSDRPDTDLFVTVTDVHPDGRVIGTAPTNILGGALRLRYRNGPEPELLDPGEVVEVTVDGWWMHHEFAAGHRIRLSIASSNFPLAARNAGTGGHWAQDEVLLPQTNTVHHGVPTPSELLLPIVAEAG